MIKASPIDLSKTNLFFMEFQGYSGLNKILSESLGRPVHPLDCLVFGGYLAAISSIKDLQDNGELITGKALFHHISGNEFRYDDYVLRFDDTGTAIYELTVSPASNLIGRIQKD